MATRYHWGGGVPAQWGLISRDGYGMGACTIMSNASWLMVTYRHGWKNITFPQLRWQAVLNAGLALSSGLKGHCPLRIIMDPPPVEDDITFWSCLGTLIFRSQHCLLVWPFVEATLVLYIVSHMKRTKCYNKPLITSGYDKRRILDRTHLLTIAMSTSVQSVYVSFLCMLFLEILEDKGARSDLPSVSLKRMRMLFDVFYFSPEFLHFSFWSRLNTLGTRAFITGWIQFKVMTTLPLCFFVNFKF